MNGSYIIRLSARNAILLKLSSSLDIIGSRNILSGNVMHIKISKNGYAYRFQRTRIGIEQVFFFDLGFAGR